MEECQCRQCLRTRKEMNGSFPMEMTIMILCPLCGNKRCPHATDHRLACTCSNEPGQAGSAYEGAKIAMPVIERELHEAYFTIEIYQPVFLSSARDNMMEWSVALDGGRLYRREENDEQFKADLRTARSVHGANKVRAVEVQIREVKD